MVFIPRKKSTKAEDSGKGIQPEINIGLIGHVDHGKTTLTESMTGKWTDTHSEEIKRGITIRLGYADAMFRKCPKCSEPECFTISETCETCKTKTEFLRKVSFVDAPGHESLMATMLSGAALMDGAMLLISANEDCPQPQTREHLMALEIVGIKNLIVVQNKVDLVTKQQAANNYKEIREFLKETSYKNAPIIPISAQKRVNLDLLIESIQKHMSTPIRDPKKDPMMFIARSFDTNKPGSDPLKMGGGVLGGALKQGVLKLKDEIEIRPGLKREKAGKAVWEPVLTKIIGLKTGGDAVKEIGPGGSAGILTLLDPAIVKSDTLAGTIVGKKEKLPPVRYDLNLDVHLLERVVGTKDKLVVDPIKQKETLMLNVNSAATVGFVTDLKKNAFSCSLKIPVCAEEGARVTISRLIGTRWRLIGYGIIKG